MKDAFGFALLFSISVLINGWYQLTFKKRPTDWFLIYWFGCFFLLVVVFSGLMIKSL